MDGSRYSLLIAIDYWKTVEYHVGSKILSLSPSTKEDFGLLLKNNPRFYLLLYFEENLNISTGT